MSTRTAALAFALSSWAEGLTQLRTVLLTPNLHSGITLEQQDADTSTPAPSGRSAGRILAWLKRKGREMDETERTSLAALDVSAAFFILRLLGLPVMPFLLSPTTMPLPRSLDRFKPNRWRHMFLITFVLSLVYEAERVTVSFLVEHARRSRDARNKKLLGEVYVRGGEHLPEENEDEQDECLICAGVGADTTLSQSISSITSMATASTMDALGPLEAFCTTAPHKHIAHRSCFLSWHAAYRQQRMHLPPEEVELRGRLNNDAIDDRMRAMSILDAAGFGYLSGQLRTMQETLPPWRSMSRTSSLPHSTLVLSDCAAPSSSSPTASNASKCLATLRTKVPPCPGCRSSVLLHFISRPASLVDTRQRGTIEDMKYHFQIWFRLWRELVTGRTVLYRLASQWSFVMALLSLMRVSSRRIHLSFA